jgi:crossover junction endodeoxyribonuclease RuvC
MIQKSLGVVLSPKHLDATDALAIALCHHYQHISPMAQLSGHSSWEKFIKENPDRVRKN